MMAKWNLCVYLTVCHYAKFINCDYDCYSISWVFLTFIVPLWLACITEKPTVIEPQVLALNITEATFRVDTGSICRSFLGVVELYAFMHNIH